MPGFPQDPLHSECHSDAIPTTEKCGQEMRDIEPSLNQSVSPVLSTLMSLLELHEDETQREHSSWSQDGDLLGCEQLETRWVLWHEFMKEHAHLDTWLRLAEQAVSSLNPAHIAYVTAKEELRKFERLRCEAGSRLVQLDNLTQKNRMLIRLFQGTMQTRLLAAARECGQRWDDMNAKLESITGGLKLFVSEWEGFEAEREELTLWLTNLDVRLTEVDHLTGNTCKKLRQLQSFQQCVCMNAGRVNVLLQRGEALIQRSEPMDAQRVESQLLELLRCCSLVYNNIARTHTRLLSMRLVFEDDWILSQAPDSGCPSESLLDEEGTLDKSHLDLFAANPTLVSSSPLHLPPPPSPPSPTHDHLGLEWDPSVDIGRSVSCDDADSSYFNASIGLYHRDGVKRRSYLSSLSSQSDISNNSNQETDSPLEGWSEHAHPSVFSPVATHRGGTQMATLTTDGQDGEPVSFYGGHVRAWLGVQSSSPPERRTSCSKAVQTDGQVECYLDGTNFDTSQQLPPHLSDTKQPFPAPSFSPSHDLKAMSDWMKEQYRSNLRAEEEPSCCEEAECLLSEQRLESSRHPSSLLSTALLCLLLAAALALLSCLIWVVLESPCRCSSRMSQSFHLTLRYVNGPPPT